MTDHVHDRSNLPATTDQPVVTDAEKQGGLSLEDRVARLERVAEYFLTKFTGGDTLDMFNVADKDDSPRDVHESVTNRDPARKFY